MLGTPAETYVFGIQNIMSNFGWFFANLLAIKIMVPLIHPLKITSAYEVREACPQVKKWPPV
jgi:sodium-dependent multivitamin transporter 6/sodium-coupled monocarboxylate transporter 8/12